MNTCKIYFKSGQTRQSIRAFHSMKLVNIKIIIISILCVLLIFMKVKTIINSSENNHPPVYIKVVSTSNSSNTKNQVPPKSDKLLLENLLQEYDSRRRHVSGMCEKYKSDIELTYRELWGSNTTWEAVLSKADILEKAEQGFLWCKVPKAASESWTSLFINKWFRSKRKSLMWKQQVYLTSRWRPKFRKLSYLNKISHSYFSWITVRHPYERILSAYRDKFFLNGNARYEQEKVARWYKWYGKEIITKYRKGNVTEEKYRKAPTFEEFIRYLVDLPISDYDEHWKPMYVQCLPCHIQYRVIARLETLVTDSQYILQTIGVSTRLQVSHQTRGTNSSNLVAEYYQQIDEKLLEQLHNIYKFDFLLFDFNPIIA